MLDGRVLRSRSLTGLDQEVYALLTTYQALIRAADTACTRPGPDTDRISFTVLRTTVADTVTTATGILPPAGPAELLGTIGRAVPDALHPARHRHRVKARTRKNPTSTYGPSAGQRSTSARTTPSAPPSCSSSTGSRPAHGRKRNGVAVRTRKRS
ncbi:hypothetical protein ACWDZ4_22225 [Streptomyces sp. NPDC003016]